MSRHIAAEDAEQDKMTKLLRANGVQHKLVTSLCKSVAKDHLILRYNFESE